MEYHPLPQPEELTEREKEDAMGAYLMMFASVGAGLPLPIINLIAAVIYYYINRYKSRFVQFHALQSLLSQFPTSIINAIGVFWAVRIIFFDFEMTDLFKGYIVMAVIANLVYFIFSIIGAVKARKGVMYYFLFFGKISYHSAFGDKGDRHKEQTAVVNKPPKL